MPGETINTEHGSKVIEATLLDEIRNRGKANF